MRFSDCQCERSREGTLDAMRHSYDKARHSQCQLQRNANQHPSYAQTQYLHSRFRRTGTRRRATPDGENTTALANRQPAMVNGCGCGPCPRIAHRLGALGVHHPCPTLASSSPQILAALPVPYRDTASKWQLQPPISLYVHRGHALFLEAFPSWRSGPFGSGTTACHARLKETACGFHGTSTLFRGTRRPPDN